MMMSPAPLSPYIENESAISSVRRRQVFPDILIGAKYVVPGGIQGINKTTKVERIGEVVG